MAIRVIHEFPKPIFLNVTLLRDNHEVLSELHNIRDQVMATASEILANVTANTDAIKALGVAADGLNEGQTSIEELIEVLKKQIADLSVPVDLSLLEAAVAEQAQVIDGLKEAVVKGTSFDPSGNA